MKRHPAINRPVPRPKRLRGFTLLELLVVIGLIIFLVSATVGVVSGVIGGAREKGTKATIRKIDGILSQRMEAFTMGLKAQELNKDDFGSVMTRKNRMIAGFPQNLVEAGLAAASYTDPDPTTISSEAMYEFITNGDTFLAPPIDSDAFTTNEVADTDSDGRNEFIDAWGKPLRFYRWPTRLIRPGNPASTPQSINSSTNTYAIAVIDPPTQPYFGNANAGDAQIFFASIPKKDDLSKNPQDFLGRISPSTFNANFTLENFEKNYHTPETWSLPLIVSAGADGILGLHEVTDKDNFGHLAQPNATEIGGILDNLSNRNLQP